MSQESRVKSYVRSAKLADALEYPNYRTVDFDDAYDLAVDRTLDVLIDLENVDVSDALKDQAASFIGQYYLERLAFVETERIADTLIRDLGNVTGDFAVMVRIPDSRTV